MYYFKDNIQHQRIKLLIDTGVSLCIVTARKSSYIHHTGFKVDEPRLTFSLSRMFLVFVTMSMYSP